MMRPTPRRAADGTTEEPLPSAVPTDADHIATPRDLRAERLSERRFSAELERLGFDSNRTRTGRVWQGLGLAAEEEE